MRSDRILIKFSCAEGFRHDPHRRHQINYLSNSYLHVNVSGNILIRKVHSFLDCQHGDSALRPILELLPPIDSVFVTQVLTTRNLLRSKCLLLHIVTDKMKKIVPPQSKSTLLLSGGRTKLIKLYNSIKLEVFALASLQTKCLYFCTLKFPES
jgi:hypothetical protein